MNKNIAALVAIIFILSVPFARAKGKQQGPEHEATVDDIVAKLTTQLELTDKQAVQVKAIIEDYMAKEKELKLEEKKELSHVLTGDQLYSWEDLQKQLPKEKKKKGK